MLPSFLIDVIKFVKITIIFISILYEENSHLKLMNTDKINEIEQNLKKYSQMNNNEILHEFDTSENGLSCIMIDEKQEEYGKNIIDINIIFFLVS